MTNKREFFRLECPKFLCADFSLIAVKGKHVTKKSVTQISIEDIGVGGIRFFTSLDLPANDDILFRIRTVILNEEIVTSGRVRWKRTVCNEVYQYGLKFSLTEQKKASLLKTLNQMSLYLRKRETPPNTRICDPDFCENELCKETIEKKSNHEEQQ